MTLPNDYFCPECVKKATHDLVMKLRGEKMPTLLIVNIALNILAEAHCPGKLLKQIVEWTEQYHTVADSGLTAEETDRLKLLAWKLAQQTEAQPKGQESGYLQGPVL